ncbi:MAG: hypothetical protein LUD17_09390 [Bacteroidales bacterium]|nr:hypothetical protein [Bacteroidales bacterium]
MAQTDLKSLKQRIVEATKMDLPEDLLHELLSSMTEIKANTYDVISPIGEVDTNLYLCKQGIVRYVYNSGNREVTHYFAPAGHILVSWHSYFHGLPSFFQMEACCKNTVVLRLPKEKFDEMVRKSHIFAQWVVNFYHSQFFLFERKIELFKGDARQRFDALLANRPDVVRHVPLGIIASYLGITPQYLSTLRKLSVTKR